MIATRLQSNVQCNQNQQIYSVYDSKSGKPIPKAKILLYKPNYPGYTLLDSFVYKFPGNGLLPKFIQTKSGLSGNQSGKSQRPHQPDLQTVHPPTAQTRTALITDRKILPARADGLLQSVSAGQQVRIRFMPWKTGKYENQLLRTPTTRKSPNKK